MKPKQCLVITREGHLLGEHVEKQWHRSYRTQIPEGKARVISTNLALYQYKKKTSYADNRYHVIHIPTGLVIADVTYDLVSTVKNVFEKERWILRGENTLILDSDKHLQWQIESKIRYTIERTQECSTD